MAIARVKLDKKLTPDEYLEFERSAETRHEYIDGVVYEMAGESLSHSQICFNLAAIVGRELKGKDCQGLSPNMKVRTTSASLFAYPDLTIVCGKPEFHDLRTDVLINPTVIVELLSPSTEKYDRTTKFLRYRMGNETLTDYILIAQDYTFVEHYVKTGDGHWEYTSYHTQDTAVTLDSVGIRVNVAEIYERVEVTEPEDPPGRDEPAV